MADHQNTPDDQRNKAKAFFERARDVGGKGQFDFAIEMFLQGLTIDPEAIEAHQGLREVSMMRKVNGGKPMGMIEKMRLRATKDPKTGLLNSEKILAHDPGDVDAMVGVLTHANKGGFWDTALWIAPEVLRANQQSAKPDIKKYLVVKDVYKDLKKYGLAVEACSLAARMKPNDMELTGELKNLSAMETMDRGNYSAGDFKASMRDREGQQKLMEEERDVRTTTAMDRKVMDAEAQFKADPNEPGKLGKLVEALVATEDSENENRAIELLTAWHQKTGQYRFRRNVGVINMKIWNRMERGRREELKAAPNDPAVQDDFKQFQKDKLEFELAEYREWSENYPTDLSLKFEIGKRLYLLGRFDEAIPEFQLSQNDPKHRAESAIYLGRSFYDAGFYDESAMVLESAINEYAGRNDDKSKLLFYWRGRALEAMTDIDAALKFYSQVAQWQFSYEDVQQRIKKLREELRGGGKK